MNDLTVELVGGAMLESLNESDVFFKHAHSAFPALGFGTNPWWRIYDYEGEQIVVGFRTLNGVEGVNEIHRLAQLDGQITAVRCYCFCPDTLRRVAGDLNLVPLDRPYRSPSIGDAVKMLSRAFVKKATFQ